MKPQPHPRNPRTKPTQVDPPDLSAVGESDAAHLRIVDADGFRARRPSSLGGQGGGGGGGGGGGKYRPGGKPAAMLSIVSVGARVSLLGRGSGGGDSGGGVVVSDVGVRRPAAAGAAGVPFEVQDLILLRSELVLDGGGGGNGGDRRGVAVKRSARLRMVNASAAVAGDGFAAEGGVGVGVTALATAGEAKLGEAWEPKPFFLGTSLSQMFPSTPTPSPPAPPPSNLQRAGDGGGDGGRGWSKAGGGDGEDCLAFDGVVVDLAGGAVVRGDVSLAGGAVVQVGAVRRRSGEAAAVAVGVAIAGGITLAQGGSAGDNLAQDL